MPTLTFDRGSLAAALDPSIREVLETMFFACVSDFEAVREPEQETRIPNEVAAHLGAHLKFSGQCTGEFAFSIEKCALASLALNFLGRTEPSASEQENASIVCEMGNMFCGSLLSRLQADNVFHLGTPFLDDGQSASTPPASAVTGSFCLDPGRLVVWIGMEAGD